MKSYIFYTFFIKILNYQNELQTHLNVEYVNYFIFKVVSVKNLIFEFRNFNNLLFKMQPISPQPNSKKSKYQLSRSNNKQRTKKKNSHQQRKKQEACDHSSYPETPRNIYDKFPAYSQAEHFARTASLTNTLIQAVENQKQILKSIKTISAEILKNRKAHQSVEQSQESQPIPRKHFFPIKKFKSQHREPCKTLYEIEESISSDDQIDPNFDEYCLLNTTKPKIHKIDTFESEQYLKPKIIAQESSTFDCKRKAKNKKNKKSKEGKINKSLKPRSQQKSILKPKKNFIEGKSKCRSRQSSSLSKQTYLPVKDIRK